MSRGGEEPRLPGVRRGFRLSDAPGAADRDAAEEIGFHLESRVDDLVRRGHPPIEARRIAEREFGDVHGAQAELAAAERALRGRERRAGRRDAVAQDLRYAVRTLRRSPLFTLAVVATLALGIGANAAIFTVVRGVLLRPLPYPAAERVVTLWTDNRRQEWPRDVSSHPNFADWRAASRSFAAMAAFTVSPGTITGGGEPERVRGVVSSPELFAVLGVRPALGRALVPDDMTSDRRVLVLADGFWRRRFGADTAIVGRTVQHNGEPYEVVGVMPPGFAFPEPTVELWRPFPASVAESPRGNYWLQVVGRLAPGATEAGARTELDEIARRLEREYPEVNEGVGVTVVGLHETVVGDVRPALLVLTGAVALVLLIACANVASLLLVRATGRSREVAVRAALGAGRRRIAQQLAVESLVLALAGGLLGVLVAVAGVRLLARFGPADLPRLGDVRVDGLVLLFALGVTLLTALAFGLPYALRAAAVSLAASLKDGGRGSGTGGRGARRALVVSQLALALVLLVGAGLLLASFRRLQTQDAGFDPARLLTTVVTLPASRYEEPERRRAFHARLLERVRAMPGVEGAALTSMLPLGGSDAGGPITVEGRAPTPGLDDKEVRWTNVSAGYVEAMGMRLRAGRAFDARDGESDGTGTVVVNEAMARLHFPDGRVIGRRLRRGGANSQQPWLTVVGVVADARQALLDGPVRPELFLPLRQLPAPTTALVVRTIGEPTAIAAAVREAVRDLDPELALGAMQPMTALWSQGLAARRFNALLIAAFAGVALLLAVVGIYGVMSYAAAARRQEVGIRLAIGARPAQVVRLVLREAVAIAAVGVALGLVLSILATRLLASLLYEVSATDPRLLAGTALLLGGTAVVAGWLPARRVARVDPLRVLRTE